MAGEDDSGLRNCDNIFTAFARSQTVLRKAV